MASPLDLAPPSTAVPRARVQGGMTTRITRRIQDIPQSDWDRVFPNVLEGYPFFKSLDESQFENFTFYYIMAYENGVPVGAAPCFLINYALDTTVEGFLKKMLAPFKRAFPGLFGMKVLVCGMPTGQGRIGLERRCADRALKAVLCGMEEIANVQKAALLAFKDFSWDDAGALEALYGEGFCRMGSYPAVKIDIKFGSFEEYLQGLSRVTRKGLKKKFREADGGKKIDVEVVDHLDGSLDEAYKLYLQTFSKSDVQFEKPSKEFFTRLSENMPGKAKYFLWRMGTRLVAFESCLVSQDVLMDQYIGMDYPAAYRHHLYYVTFRDILNWCIQNGIRRYESGALNYEPKKRLGCDFIALSIYVKHRNRYVNPLLRMACRFIRPENFDRVLRQLKKEGRL